MQHLFDVKGYRNRVDVQSIYIVVIQSWTSFATDTFRDQSNNRIRCFLSERKQVLFSSLSFDSHHKVLSWVFKIINFAVPCSEIFKRSFLVKFFLSSLNVCGTFSIEVQIAEEIDPQR